MRFVGKLYRNVSTPQIIYKKHTGGEDKSLREYLSFGAVQN